VCIGKQLSFAFLLLCWVGCYCRSLGSHFCAGWGVTVGASDLTFLLGGVLLQELRISLLCWVGCYCRSFGSYFSAVWGVTVGASDLTFVLGGVLL
jgi:hypothetical protein